MQTLTSHPHPRFLLQHLSHPVRKYSRQKKKKNLHWSDKRTDGLHGEHTNAASRPTVVTTIACGATLALSHYRHLHVCIRRAVVVAAAAEGRGRMTHPQFAAVAAVAVVASTVVAVVGVGTWRGSMRQPVGLRVVPECCCCCCCCWCYYD